MVFLYDGRWKKIANTLLRNINLRAVRFYKLDVKKVLLRLGNQPKLTSSDLTQNTIEFIPGTFVPLLDTGIIRS